MYQTHDMQPVAESLPVVCGTDIILWLSQGSQSEWQRVFLLSAGLSAAGWLCFLLLVSTEEQEWAKPKGADLPMETQVSEDKSPETVDLMKQQDKVNV